MVDRREALSSALELLFNALALLDEADAPGQIGAHVDLAAHQLQELVDSGWSHIKDPPGNC